MSRLGGESPIRALFGWVGAIVSEWSAIRKLGLNRLCLRPSRAEGYLAAELRVPTIRATCSSRQAEARRVRQPREFNSAAIPRSV
jgi:hypothetical protein